VPAGDVIENPAARMKLLLVQTAAETDGELLEMEATYEPGSVEPPEHFHPKQDERFEILAGEPAVYRSSPGVERRFCRDCGSPLTYEGERWPDQTHIMVCSLDDPVALQPTAHVHTDEQLTWLHLADGLPRE